MTMQEKLEQAIEHRMAKRFDESRRLLEELYADHPNDALVNYHFAWLNDVQGDERAAIPFYERAVGIGLPREDLRRALLGMGSTYRCIGEYEKAIATLKRGAAEFPDSHEFTVFLAMALYNTGTHQEAVESLLKVIAQTSSDTYVQQYQRAILFYADGRLNETW